MPIKDILFYIIASLGSLGLLAGGLGFLISQFTSGNKKDKQDVINSADKLTQFWKDQADGYKEMMERKEIAATDKINKLTGELGKLQGRYDERDKQYQEVVAILKDRNPETEAFMKLMTANAQDQLEYRKKTLGMFDSMIKVLGDIHTMSASNHTMLEGEATKELKIEGVVTKASPTPAPVPTPA